MSDLIAELKAALGAKDERVRTCEEALTAAKSDRDAFAKNIAEQLGITTAPQGADRSVIARDRRDKVAQLHEAGKSILEIVAELKTTRALVDNDLGKLRKAGRIGNKSPEPTESVPASTADSTNRGPNGVDALPTAERRVYELASRGMNPGEIANRLQTSIACVYTHTSNLRKKGLLPAKADVNADEAGEEPENDAEPEDEHGEPEIDDGRQDSNEKGASKEALQAEVARQQGGIRGKVVLLGCTPTKQHRHTVRVDRMGDGHTTPDASGHVHRCYRFALSEAQRHTHDVTIAKGAA